MRKDRWIGGCLVLMLVVLVGIGLLKTAGRAAPDRICLTRRAEGIMGTRCRICAVVPAGQAATAENALQEAEATLRSAEARLSTWLHESELGRFNAAAAGEHVPLSGESLQVLSLARDAHRQTGGVLDVTCRPVIELWRDAAKRGKPPTSSELARARAASSWDLIELSGAGAVKRKDTARVDLGAIAKGYAIDRAAEVLRSAGVSGGMVEVGGDLVCFGQAPAGDSWTVDVRDPAGSGKLATLRLRGDGAVCTSGNYERYHQVAGRRYSHIIDPRSGLPADEVVSATVVAPDAVTADVWATALSVLGPEGLQRLPAGVEAMLATGSGSERRMVCTDGFRELLEEPLE